MFWGVFGGILAVVWEVFRREIRENYRKNVKVGKTNVKSLFSIFLFFPIKAL